MRVLIKVLRIIAGVFCTLLTAVVVLALVVAPLGVGQIDQAITMVTGATTTKIEGGSNTQYFTSDYATPEEQHEAAALLGKNVEAEGMVLLANHNDALPLAAGSRVSLLGQDSVDFVYGGAGSASIDSSSSHTLRESLEAAGLVINPTLWDFYATGEGAAYRKRMPDINGKGGFEVNEAPVSALEAAGVTESLAEHDDAAIVSIGRAGSESTDLPAGYLNLSAEEQDLLSYARKHFDRVIVLLNTSNPVELGYLEQVGVDAVLWVGAVGQTGIDAIGDVVCGTTNPSGRLTDTYAYDVDAAPAMANLGDYTITNSEVDAGNKYLVYAEGIYVGYRYYETRYEDAVLGQGNAGTFDYDAEVQWPFGYGLSYTTFAWSDYAVSEKPDGSFELSVTVTNTGGRAGKDVVEAYLQKPYAVDDAVRGVEKAAIELAAFEKTRLLEPGESQQLTMTVEASQLLTYDSAQGGTDGAGGYTLDAGTYYLALGRDAHDALNNVLAVKQGSADEAATAADAAPATEAASLVYAHQVDALVATAVTGANGAAITNQFSDADLRTYDKDFTYLTRSDWEGSMPATYQGGSWEAPADLLADLELDQDVPAAEPIKCGSVDNPDLTLAQLIGADYDDARWNDLLNKLSKQELWDLVRRSGYLTQGIPSIGLPQVTLKDGSNGITSTLTGGGVSAMAWPSEMVLAATFNRDLVHEVGVMSGNDAIATDVTVWYAPSMDLHRTAYSGRNFEYYSEDPYLSGEMGAAETAGAVSKGVIVTLKHFALNDQETNRIGGAVFANEQSVRELYLKPFQMSVEKGGANGVMVSMNRLGATWAGGHAGLMTNVLRGEWGFEGFATTDQTSLPTFSYSDIREGLAAGTNMWLNATEFMWNLSDEELTDGVLAAARESAHRILYAYANSNAMNGLSADAQVVDAMPSWMPPAMGMYALLVLFGWVWYKLACLCFGCRTLWQIIRKKPKKRGLRA